MGCVRLEVALGMGIVLLGLEQLPLFEPSW